MVKYKERRRFQDRKDLILSVRRDFPFQNWNPPLATVVPLAFYVPRFQNEYERFWEDDGSSWDNGFFVYKKDQFGRYIWKPCQHYLCYTADPIDQTALTKIPWSTDSITALGTYSTGKEGGGDRLLAADHPQFRSLYGTYGEHFAGLPSMTVENKDKSFVADPVGLSTLVEKSLKSTLPGIKSELSLVNSIIELKDFKSLPHTLANIGNVLRKISSFRRLISKEFSSRLVSHHSLGNLTLAEVFHASADGYLQAKFNVLPLLQDICGIFNACTRLSKTMNRLVQNQGRPQRRHYTYQWLYSQFAGASSELIYLLDQGQFAGSQSPSGETGVYKYLRRQIHVAREVIIQDPSTFHAEIEYNYHFTQYQNEHARILGLLDSLGVNLNPQIIWNAIPWSFVVDWVIGVGQWLGNRKTLNMEPVVNISRYMWSFKSKRRIRISFWDTVSGGPKITRTWLPDLYESIYRRDVKLPTRSDSLYGSGLSATELSLGVALAITQSFHPKRRLRGSRIGS